MFSKPDGSTPPPFAHQKSSIQENDSVHQKQKHQASGVSFLHRSKPAWSAAAALILAAMFILFLDWICPVRALSGFSCPGCGMTRALMALFKGNLSESFLWHPMLIPTLIMAGTGCIVWLAGQRPDEKTACRVRKPDLSGQIRKAYPEKGKQEDENQENGKRGNGNQMKPANDLSQSTDIRSGSAGRNRRMRWNGYLKGLLLIWISAMLVCWGWRLWDGFAMSQMNWTANSLAGHLLQALGLL